MNFRQIKMLNDLCSSTTDIGANVADLQVKLDEMGNQLQLLEQVRENDLERIRLLENPPKRKPGRPRKHDTISAKDN